MTWNIKRYPDFRDDLQHWHESDKSLADEFISRCYSIEDDPLKGERKLAGPIAGCRAVYVRGTDYAIIYRNEPDVFIKDQKDSIDTVHFYGIKKHDNQADARTGTESPLDSMYQFTLDVPSSEEGRIRSAMYDAEGIYLEDVEWGNSARFEGTYEGSHESLFESIASEGEIIEQERRPLEEFLEDP